MMKITEEDKEFEEFIMSGAADIAVPLEITARADGYELTVYSRFAPIAEEFACLFENDPFSPEAIAFLKDKLEPEMKKAGYEFSEKDSPLVFRFIAEKESLRPVPGIDGQIVKISTNCEFEKYYNNATRDIELDDDDENDVCFAVVKDECIMSFAGVNDILDDGCLDINVESAVGARGKNFATAAVVSLAEYLLDRGERICYRCRKTNVPSRRVAEKAGFIKESVTYSFVCYAADEE